MRVEPDKGNWDGTEITEEFGAPKGDCPLEEFKIQPCAGNSTFIVGKEASSKIFGSLPAQRNRFYDLHETRWRGGSLLHDRNPRGIKSCSVSCEQSYSCAGKNIGKHTVTRHFRAEKSGKKITEVSVEKS